MFKKGNKLSQTHGKWGTKTYWIWHSMKDRCLNPNNSRFSYYGSKGIKVCKRWLKFENFLEDMGEKPISKEIDRIESSKGYFKDNCRWVTKNHNIANRIIKRKYDLPRGVTKVGNRFYSGIKINYQRYYLGCFKTSKEAENSYLEIYQEWYGELPPEYRRAS